MLAALGFVGPSAALGAVQQEPQPRVEAGEHEVADSSLEPRVRRVVRSALPLLQRSADTWIQRKSCTSCHHQTLGAMAIHVAREAGFEVHDGLAAKQTAHIRRSIGRSNAEFPQGIGPSTFGAAFGAWGMHIGDEADRTTPVRALAWLMSIQQENGQLPSLSHRPPMEHRSATGTALLIHAVRRWGAHLPGTESARDRAARWLDQHDPTDTESAAWRLLGLYWQGHSPQRLMSAAQPLLETQQPDGAWRQHELRPTDAYATGLALAALLQTGQLRAADPQTIAATEWLVEDFDRERSAWHVATRRRVEGLPYFESGFPYGEDQFISYGASAWAVTALVLALREEPSAALAPPGAAPNLSPTAPCGDMPALLCAARWRGDEDFVKQLQAASPDSLEVVDEAGLHLLMAAAGKPSKLGSVLERVSGSVDRPSELGRTALHVATLAPDPVDARRSVDLLLERGADPNVADRQGLTPLHLAVRRADTALVERLLRAGAKTTVIAPGVDGVTPLGAAIGAGAADVVAQLLDAGADPAVAMTAYRSDALQEAIYSDQPAIAAMLVAEPMRASKLLKLADIDGYTAAHYLFLQPFGDSRMARIILEAGADLDRPDNEGHSARDLAEKEGLEVLLEVAEANDADP